ncbi:hypothetical protein V5O48_016290, partial [Marasmius crinis-equi]
DEIEAGKFFVKREGWPRRKLTFVWEDGKEYKWILGVRNSKLVLDDESQTPIAKFHPKNIGGIFGEKRQADLEIFPPGEGMADVVLLTFVYAERIRSN